MTATGNCNCHPERRVVCAKNLTVEQHQNVGCSQRKRGRACRNHLAFLVAFLCTLCVLCGETACFFCAGKPHYPNFPLRRQGLRSANSWPLLSRALFLPLVPFSNRRPHRCARNWDSWIWCSLPSSWWLSPISSAPPQRRGRRTFCCG